MGKMHHVLNKIAESPIIGHLAFLLGEEVRNEKKNCCINALRNADMRYCTGRDHIRSNRSTNDLGRYRLCAKCQDIDDPSLMVKSVRTSMTRQKNDRFNY
jgi:hypothetical protein